MLAHGCPPASAASPAARIRRTLANCFGVSPTAVRKQFARIRRLRSAGTSLLEGSQSWAGVAASHGFADQSHLIHEFSQLTGLTPVAFEARLRRIEHGRIIS